MFVTNIPNGTSLDIQRGTALYLIKKLVQLAKDKVENIDTYDSMRINQVSGCLGITPEEAKTLCRRVLQGETEEAVIDEYSSRSLKYKEETVVVINRLLAEVRK
ncbi:MAG: hypothetical protein WA118_08040 [Carboxydocellales bacterium]